MTHSSAALKPVEAEIRRKAIVDAAIALADSHGLIALTMRAVAARLGVGTMTLYSYVEAKDELIELMLDQLGGEMLLPEPLPAHWRVGLKAIAQHTRAVLEAHPWMFKAAMRAPGHGANFLRHIEQSLTVVASLDVDHAQAAAIIEAVDDYTLGFTMRSRAQELRADPPTPKLIEVQDLPHLRELLSTRRATHGRVDPQSLNAGFEQGLDWLLDGIEAWLGGRG